ncbi:MAG: FmdB family zinc ribbon protein [Pseudonocardiaceae bacterium]
MTPTRFTSCGRLRRAPTRNFPAEVCMPIYVYRCDCGLRFERLVEMDSPAPECPTCGDTTRKMPAGLRLSGQADAGLSRDHMPQTWRGLYHGDREYVTRMQRQWDRRQQVEAKYPELAGDTRPILAHEGRYHKAPLRAGDPVVNAFHSEPHEGDRDESADETTTADGRIPPLWCYSNRCRG